MSNGESNNRSHRAAMAAVLVGLLAVAAPLAANPVAAELGETFELLDGGDQVEVSFLGMMSAADYDQSLLVQWQVDGSWEKAGGSWSQEGSEEAEGGSGVMTYDRFTRTVSCPAAGDQHLRLAFQDPEDPDDDIYEWSDATIRCTSAGPAADTGDGGCSVSGRPGRAASGAGLLALACGILVLARRRR